MSKFNRRDKRDSNHSDIVKAIQGLVEVIQIERPLDLLVYDPVTDTTGWIEIKTLSRSAEIKSGQLHFIANTKMRTQVVKTPQEAIDFVTDWNGMTDEEKARIGKWLEGNKDKGVHPALFERIVEGLE